MEEAGREALCQWFTPPAVSLAFLAWSRIEPGDVVLEPAAGEGSLVPPDRGRVLAFEIDPECASELAYWRPMATVVCANFLDLPTPEAHVADVSVQNPPFSNTGEGVFIDRALDWAPRVCALVRGDAMHGKARYEVCWRRVSITRLAYLVSRPRYLGPFGLPTPHNPSCDFVAIEAVRRVGVAVDRPEVTWVDWK
jgi:hypothetical protein